MLESALESGYCVVVLELLAISFIRYRFMETPLLMTIVQVIAGGRIVFGIGIWLWQLGAG